MGFSFEAAFYRSLLAESGLRPERLLVIGCGAGAEVAHLAAATGAQVVGVDGAVQPQWARPNAALLRADAEALPFPDASFDALYCYHVLEHVSSPARAIAEARRVLRSGGMGYVGTPNRARLLGYVGGRGSTADALRWNLVDWGLRLRGRWSNAQGAHAGFTRAELSRLLGASFARVESVDLAYYRGKYPRLAGFWTAAFRSGLAHRVAPSVYFRVGGLPPAG